MFLNRVGGTFRSQETLTPDEVENSWRALRSAIALILQHQSSDLSFEELYRTSYNLVIHRFGGKLYDDLQSLIGNHLSLKAQSIDKLLSETRQFTRRLDELWADHTHSMKMIRDVMMYMDRNYVRQYNKAPLKDLGLKLFQDKVLFRSSFQEVLVRGTIDAIEECRHGKGDPFQASSLLSIFTGTSDGQDCRDVMKTVFVPEYTRRSRLFYGDEAAILVKNEKFEEFLSSGIRSYTTEQKLFPVLADSGRTVLDACWVDEYADSNFFQDNFSTSLRERRLDVLKSAYALFSRTGKGRQGMFSVFRNEVLRRFGQTESKISIQEIVQTIRETELLVKTSFGKEFMIELESVVDGLFSRSNEVTLRLSEFLDEGIRKGEPAARFDDSLLVFKYIRSKDVFEAYYRFHLGRRLLSSSSTDMETEKDFVSRLKLECGQSYVAKIEAMMNDVDNSRELVSSWRAETRAEMCDFFHQPLVLSTSVWSHIKLVNPRLVLPGIMRESLEVFASFYTSKFAGRKLTWAHSQGSAEVKHVGANCLLTVSTIQAVILDQLNHSDHVSSESISKKTNLAVDDLKRHLLSLHVNPKCPILKKKESEDVLIVNESFEPKSRHVKVPLIVESSAISMPELTGDTDTGIGVERVVEEDRKHLIEAAIVRIMKSKRQLDHNNLIVEITKYLENRFVPSVQVIKEKVENLIDREYIARDNDDVKLYYYVA